MNIDYIWEHNGDDSIIFADNCPGAFVRGESKDMALEKFDSEIISYITWMNGSLTGERIDYTQIGEHKTDLSVCDADSEVIFDSELLPLLPERYENLKTLALKSAISFQKLFDSVPEKDAPLTGKRKTFYGDMPVTAREMYEHTKSVNSYYFGEIGIEAGNTPDIFTCREAAFELLENGNNRDIYYRIFDGSNSERWSLSKVCRRFIWHDRIHAKAMYRRAVNIFGRESIDNTFYFQ